MLRYGIGTLTKIRRVKIQICSSEVNFSKSLNETHTSQGNVPLMYLINTKILFIS